MRIWLYITPFLLLFGCEQDVLVPCENELQPSGKVCREYRYYNDQPQGFVEFEHQGDTVLVSRIYSQRSIVEKTIREQFYNGQITVLTEQYPNEASRVRSFHYNEIDSLSLIVYGANDSSMTISYENGKRLREAMQIDGMTTHYREYRYYQDDGKLYRISEYDANDSLLSYRNFDYFNGNGSTFYRVTYYTADHELIGRRRFSFTQNGLISSMEYRLANGALAESKDYIYDSALKLTEEYGQFYGNSSKSVYLYY